MRDMNAILPDDQHWQPGHPASPPFWTCLPARAASTMAGFTGKLAARNPVARVRGAH